MYDIRKPTFSSKKNVNKHKKNLLTPIVPIIPLLIMYITIKVGMQENKNKRLK